MRRISCCLLLVLCVLTSCSKSDVQLSFNSWLDLDKFDGKEISIRGYMATLSPVTGDFIYLMNLPYQQCPFCLPSTSTVTNTIVAFAKKGDWFTFYDGPIELTGKLELGDFTDEFGYSYEFRLVDATYTKLSVSELSKNLKVYGSLVQDEIIKDLRDLMDKAMNDSQFIGTFTESSTVSAVELDKIIYRIESISKTEYKDLIKIIRDFQTLNNSLKTDAEISTIQSQMSEVYIEFIFWLNKFEI